MRIEVNDGAAWAPPLFHSELRMELPKIKVDLRCIYTSLQSKFETKQFA